MLCTVTITFCIRERLSREAEVLSMVGDRDFLQGGMYMLWAPVSLSEPEVALGKWVWVGARTLGTYLWLSHPQRQ